MRLKMKEGLVKRPILCMLIFLFIIGCATHFKYIHPTKDDIDFENDKNECAQMANQYAVNVGSKDDPIVISVGTEQCLEKRGWVRVEDKSFFDTFSSKVHGIRKY